MPPNSASNCPLAASIVNLKRPFLTTCKPPWPRLKIFTDFSLAQFQIIYSPFAVLLWAYTYQPDNRGALMSDDLQILDLRNKYLASLPQLSEDPTTVKKLYLDGNQLTALPEWLGDLANLDELHLDLNALSALPASLNRLTN